ncbi:MAG: hypothetical protein Kow0088_04040 [Anaerolineales bacterium]
MSSALNLIVPSLIVCFSYIVFFGLITKLRRETLSLQFALEALTFTLILVGVVWTTRFSLHPAINLFLLYLVTMRVRLLTEVGTFFARRNQFQQATKIYAIAQRAFPDPSSLVLLRLNQATALIKQANISDAIAVLEDLLKGEKAGYLGTKYETAAHYNLGVAYLKADKRALATIELNKAIEAMPLSEYAVRAEKILGEQRRPREKS